MKTTLGMKLLIVGICIGSCSYSLTDSNPYKEKSNVSYESSKYGVSMAASYSSYQMLSVEISNQSSNTA